MLTLENAKITNWKYKKKTVKKKIIKEKGLSRIIWVLQIALQWLQLLRSSAFQV